MPKLKPASANRDRKNSPARTPDVVAPPRAPEQAHYGSPIVVLGAVTLFAVASFVLVMGHKPALPRRGCLAAPCLATLRVVASFYPLGFFAQEIGGDLVDVRVITPAGAEPHDYEPTARDVAAIEDADVLLLNGGGFEPWGDRILSVIGNARTVTVEAGETLATLQAGEGEGGHRADPHVWLDPMRAADMVDLIVAGFMRADPDDAGAYLANAEGLKARLAALDGEFRAGLTGCESRDLVTAHAAFGYLARAYGLTQTSVAGITPDAEPSPREIADVAEFVRAHHVRTVFFESLVTPKFSDTIAKEAGVTTAVLDPIEGLPEEDAAAGADYFSAMRANLANLKTALRCPI